MEEVSKIHNNRCMVLLRLKRWKHAWQAATDASIANPKNWLALYRRARAAKELSTADESS
eukprot:CAMPEP_0202844062 /NCGR_PEP_ID=MMETSP1389-20130828/66274_1 /ASSEMBLY_ACC=CAM_ASM_000865 /TAXON_ID=302021 /ORGANISM="Rhodomonas sp., Strain CCMP768" /LENGTH=59 /DNA_ID=CAMNT_0049521291 /DNA_START=1 /DNA_END=176 /DNA_ORIENTATION=-